MAEYTTPPRLAKRLGIAEDKVYAWIASGQLLAINMAAHPDGERARWRISEDAISDFLARRTSKPAASTPAKQRRRRAPTGKQYF